MVRVHDDGEMGRTIFRCSFVVFGLISVLVVFAVCCISLVSGFDLCCAVICAYSYSQVVFAASLSPLALIFAVSSKSAKERFQLCRVHTAFFLGDFQFRFGVLRLGTYTFALSRVVSALLGCWFADRGGFFYQRPLWLLLFYLKFREKDAFSMVLYACVTSNRADFYLGFSQSVNGSLGLESSIRLESPTPLRSFARL